jgi:hypothetical protein
MSFWTRVLPRWSMEWWKRRMRSASPPPRGDSDEAAAMRAREQDALARTRARGDEVDRVADNLERHRHENHFADLLAQAFRSGT